MAHLTSLDPSPRPSTGLRPIGRFGAAALGLLLAAGCHSVPRAGADDPAAAPGGRPVADLRGQRVDVRVGEPFDIRLPSNPSTGYRWTLVDPIPVTVRADGVARYEAGASGVAGAPGVETWSFVGVAAGPGQLRFEYRRPWEPATIQPAQRASFRVDVR